MASSFFCLFVTEGVGDGGGGLETWFINSPSRMINL